MDKSVEEYISNIVQLSSFTGEKCGIGLVRNLLNIELERSNGSLSAADVNRIIDMAEFQADMEIRKLGNEEIISKINSYMKK